MRYKAYTHDSGRQLNSFEDFIYFRENGIFVSKESDRTFGLTSKLADGVYKMAKINLYFIPESNQLFNVDVITNAVDGYQQPPITNRKRIHNTWVKFTELTFMYLKSLS